MTELDVDKTVTIVCPVCGATPQPGQVICPTDNIDFIRLEQNDVFLLPGAMFEDRFQIVNLIGAGGMGVLYKAKQLYLQSFVAIKMLRLTDQTNETYLRFQYEGKAASSLKHPNIATVYDFNKTADGYPYLIMDFIDGISLARVLTSQQFISPVRAINIAMEVCDGMAYAHEHGIIHRDLKPSNIMLSTADDGTETTRVIDFGLAKVIEDPDQKFEQGLTKAGQVFGSPFYMSPEQCRAQPLDARSDIYSLGVLLYESLTGFLPLAAACTVETMYMHINTPAPPFAARGRKLTDHPLLENVVLKCLAKSPADRYQNMHELKADLKAVKENDLRRLKHLLPDKQSTRPPLYSIPLAIVLVLLCGLLAHRYYLSLGDSLQTRFLVPAEKAVTAGNVEEAERLLQVALAQAEQLPFRDDIVTICLDKLGQCYLANGKYQLARRMLQRSLTIRLARGINDCRLAENYSSLAQALSKTGDSAAADNCFRKAGQLFEQVQERDEQRYADSLLQYATFLRSSGKASEAEQVEGRAKQLEALKQSM